MTLGYTGSGVRKWDKNGKRPVVIRLVMALSNCRVFCPGTLGTCRPYLRTIPAER